MSPPERCDICSRPASQHHAEDYYDLSTWIEICAGCHGILHKRFANPAAWSRRLDVFGIAPDHWARLISPEPFHLADYLRARGAVEPTAEALALQLSKATSRRPQQDFTEMGLNRGDQLVFAPAPDEVVIVENDRHLAWRGQLYSLTALTRLLAANSGCSRSTRHWRIGEQLLDDIYDNTYGMLG